jgi:hypothetical protein
MRQIVPNIDILSEGIDISYPIAIKNWKGFVKVNKHGGGGPQFEAWNGTPKKLSLASTHWQGASFDIRGTLRP